MPEIRPAIVRPTGFVGLTELTLSHLSSAVVLLSRKSFFIWFVELNPKHLVIHRSSSLETMGLRSNLLNNSQKGCQCLSIRFDIDNSAIVAGRCFGRHRNTGRILVSECVSILCNICILREKKCDDFRRDRTDRQRERTRDLIRATGDSEVEIDCVNLMAWCESIELMSTKACGVMSARPTIEGWPSVFVTLSCCSRG
jgi:hypothetical protein